MNDIHQRTRMIVASFGPNPNAFSVKTRILPPIIHYVLGTKSRKSKPSFDFIHKVLTTFPEISPRWYVLGEGMWNADDRKPLNKQSVKINQTIQQINEENKKLKLLYAEERLVNEALKEKIRKIVK